MPFWGRISIGQDRMDLFISVGTKRERMFSLEQSRSS
jgi:hypothetical protein